VRQLFSVANMQTVKARSCKNMWIKTWGLLLFSLTFIMDTSASECWSENCDVPSGKILVLTVPLSTQKYRNFLANFKKYTLLNTRGLGWTNLPFRGVAIIQKGGVLIYAWSCFNIAWWMRTSSLCLNPVLVIYSVLSLNRTLVAVILITAPLSVNSYIYCKILFCTILALLLLYDVTSESSFENIRVRLIYNL